MSNPSAGVLELTDTLIEYEFDPDCEHSKHDTDPDCHHGPAKWVQRKLCDCNKAHQILVCDRWRAYVLQHPDTLFHCPYCKTHNKGRDMSYTKI